MIEEARRIIARARSIAVLTGAGISAESGIPTFRGAGGLWRNYRAEELATQQAFDRDPRLVWDWYCWRRGMIAKAEPNAGHTALAELERRCPQFTLITQNVDGLHDRAGSRRPLKVHGDIWISRCSGCAYQRQDRTESYEELPRCPDCGALLRPGVVWFGESLPRIVWDEAERAVHRCDVFLVVGTSAQVYPAAGLVNLANRATTIDINLDQTPISNAAQITLCGKAGEILPGVIP